MHQPHLRSQLAPRPQHNGPIDEQTPLTLNPAARPTTTRRYLERTTIHARVWLSLQRPTPRSRHAVLLGQHCPPRTQPHEEVHRYQGKVSIGQKHQ